MTHSQQKMGQRMRKTEVIDWLKSKISSAKLYRHVTSTQDMMAELAGIYGVDIQKAMLSGLLHDCAKQLSDDELVSCAKRYLIPLDQIRLVQPGLLHAPVGAKLVQAELGLDDEEILAAIAVHNTGSEGMSKLGKILYLADSSEPNRDYPGVQHIRELALGGNLDKALLATMDMKILHVLDRGYMLHPMSLDARNDILKGRKDQ